MTAEFMLPKRPVLRTIALLRYFFPSKVKNDFAQVLHRKIEKALATFYNPAGVASIERSTESYFSILKFSLLYLQAQLTQNQERNYLKSKSIHYTRHITLKRVTSGGAYLRGFALAVQHSSEETLQRWRDVGDTVSGLTDPGFQR